MSQAKNSIRKTLLVKLTISTELGGFPLLTYLSNVFRHF